MKKFILLLLFAFQIAFTPTSTADEFIFNTGPAPDDNRGLHVGQAWKWGAVEFSLESPVTITSVKGWMRPIGAGGEMEIAILSGRVRPDGSRIPVNVLYSGSVSLTVFDVAAWAGLSGLDWYLDSGTYWVSFGDIRASLPDSSVDAVMPNPSVQPQSNEALWRADRGWMGFPNLFLGIGVQVIAASDDAPAPVCWQANGHCYQNIAAPVIAWSDAKIAAENMMFRGARGHLATITSQDEQDFIDTTVMPPPDQVPAFGGTRGWIGGYQPVEGGPFEWITGEPFVYTNWRYSSPDGALHTKYVEMNWEVADWNDTADFDDAIDGYLVEFSPKAFVLCPEDVNGDDVTDIAVVMPDGRVMIKDVIGNSISQFVFGDLSGVVDVEITDDVNGNGSEDLVALGSGSVKTEIRDSLTGEQLSLVDFEPTLLPIDLERVIDSTYHGIDDYHGLAVLGPGLVEVKGAVSARPINTVSFNTFFNPKDLVMVPDLNGDAIWELGVLGDHKDPNKNDKVEIRDATNGAILQNIWLGRGWDVLQQAIIHNDLNGNGSAELAILRTSNSADHVNVVIRDTRSREVLGSIGFDPRYTPVRMLILAGDVVVLGQRPDSGYQKAVVKDLKNGGWISTVSFDRNIVGVDMTTCPDINGNGHDELVFLGRRASDGDFVVIVKDARSGVRISRVDYRFD